MNLAVNARDAVRAHGGGQVTHPHRPPDPGARPRPRLSRRAQGDQALIEVSDDGPGIPPEVMDKIFDPFFTTKPVGEGTGLGLATVYGIVKQSDGWIHVDSKPGEGAAFRIFLPVHVPAARASPRAGQPAAPQAARRARPLRRRAHPLRRGRGRRARRRRQACCGPAAMR